MVSGGQQKGAAADETQVICGGGQMHRPSRQMNPSGQQIGALDVPQILGLGQQMSPIRIVSGGHTHVPSRHTVPSGQQCRFAVDPQT
jgi:hypothetical protein